MNYSPEDIRNGQQIKIQANETPSSFASMDGAAQMGESKTFGTSRKAGEVGQRALDMMNNPVEIKRTQNWMSQFGMSNEGMQFNQARMMMSNPQPSQEEGEK